jgi:hypothetical protein
MYPHRIRLRGPWEVEPPGAPPRRLVLPCRWAESGLSFTGPARFRRRFGYPGTIDADERVWLTGDGVGGRVAVRLNGTAIGEAEGAFTFEVTALLRARNELLLDVAVVEQGGLYGEVALEVRRTAYLRGVRAEPNETGGLYVCGEVVGAAARPLELYVLRDRFTVGYSVVGAAEEGQPFGLPIDGAGGEVQVDLVDGAEVWYTVRITPRPTA